MIAPASVQIPEHPVAPVSGQRLLAAFGIGVAVSALAAIATYYAAHFAIPAVNPGVLTQLIVAEVYLLLITAVALAFRPIQEFPVAFRFSSLPDLAFALAAWMIILVASAAIYVVLKPVFGTPTHVLFRLLTDATDVKHLQGQPAISWVIAIPRGCLLAPLFEELFFRGALLQWLRRYSPDPLAIILSAALFAAMHVYPIAMPYAFIFGVFTAWIRIRTGSTFNTVFMHALNNLFFLGLGFLLLT